MSIQKPYDYIISNLKIENLDQLQLFLDKFSDLKELKMIDKQVFVEKVQAFYDQLSNCHIKNFLEIIE